MHRFLILGAVRIVLLGAARAAGQASQPAGGVEGFIAPIERAIQQRGGRIPDAVKAAGTISQWAKDRQILGEGETPKEQVQSVMKHVLQPLAENIGQRNLTVAFTPQRAKPYTKNKTVISYCVEGELRRADLPLQTYMTPEQAKAWKSAKGDEKKAIEAAAAKLKDERETLNVAVICLPIEVSESHIRDGKTVSMDGLLMDISLRGNLGEKAGKHDTVIARRLLLATQGASAAMSAPPTLGAGDTAAVSVRWRK